jgi:hypothetical protein
VKSRALRFVLSIVAGFATFITVLAVLNYTGGNRFVEPYHYLWGVTHGFAQRIDPAPPFDPAHYGETGEFYGPFGAFFDFYFGIAFWTFLFASVYFLFVFRSKPTDLTKSR